MMYLSKVVYLLLKFNKSVFMLIKLRLVLILILLLFCSNSYAEQNNNRIIYDMPDEIALQQFGKTSGFGLSTQEITAITSEIFTGDTLKVLVIMVEWSDRPGTFSQPTFDSMIFSQGVYPGGSVADYFNEVSYGNLTVVGDVIDWYDASSYSVFFDFESILPTLDAFVDFSQYDGNSDGDVDAVIFLRSGTGQEDSHDADDIWSYASSYSIGEGPGPFDGKRISKWNTSPELKPFREPVFGGLTGEDSLNHIRVFVHELSHNLGLPDLYDYDDKLIEATYNTPDDFNDHPVMDWGLMGYYGYSIFSYGSIIPSHLCGWSKKELGWIDPIILEGEFSNLVIKDIETHYDSSLYLVPISTDTSEYFLLEYRNNQSTGLYDKLDSDFSAFFGGVVAFGADPLDRGLLITHVDDSVTENWDPNRGTPTYSHYTVAVEDAGYNPLRDYRTNPPIGFPTDSADWWYPYETRLAATYQNTVDGQDLFSPTTTPNSNGYDKLSGIVIRVDSIVGD